MREKESKRKSVLTYKFSSQKYTEHKNRNATFRISLRILRVSFNKLKCLKVSDWG